MPSRASLLLRWNPRRLTWEPLEDTRTRSLEACYGALEAHYERMSATASPLSAHYGPTRRSSLRSSWFENTCIRASTRLSRATDPC
jgi:hypothetical protein